MGSKNMEPQTALAEKKDHHIEDESFPAGKVKDKDSFYIDNENLPEGQNQMQRKETQKCKC